MNLNSILLVAMAGILIGGCAPVAEMQKKIGEDYQQNKALVDQAAKIDDSVRVRKGSWGGVAAVQESLALPPTFEQPVSIAPNDIPANFAFSMLLSGVAPLSLADPQTADYLSRVRVSGVFGGSVRHALDSLASKVGVYYRYDGTRIVVSRFDTKCFSFPETFGKDGISFSVDMSASKGGNIQAPSVAGQSGSSAAQTSTAGGADRSTYKYDGADSWDELVKMTKSMLSTEGKVEANRSVGLVCVTDSPVVLSKASSFMGQVKTQMSKSIYLDVKIVQVALDTAHKDGIEWQLLANNPAVTLATTTSGLVGSGVFALAVDALHNPQLTGSQAVINMLKKHGDVSTLYENVLVARNNRPAVVESVNGQGYIENTVVNVVPSGSGTTTSTQVTQSEFTSGVRGYFVVHVDGNTVYLDVLARITDLKNLVPQKVGDTTVQLKNWTGGTIQSEGIRLSLGQTAVVTSVATMKSTVSRESNFGLAAAGINSTGDARSVLVMIVTPRYFGS